MPASHLCTTMHDANNLSSRSLVQLKLCTDGSARHVWHLPSQEKADAMITHLASLADQRLIISFAPFTPYYAVLKRIGELFPGPSKVSTVLSVASLHSSRPVSECCIRGGSRVRISHHRALGSISNTVIPIAFQAAPCRFSPGRVVPSPDPARLPLRLFSGPSQATRAYLHAESDVEAALERAGFKVCPAEMSSSAMHALGASEQECLAHHA